jgi:hypothetical protein
MVVYKPNENRPARTPFQVARYRSASFGTARQGQSIVPSRGKLEPCRIFTIFNLLRSVFERNVFGRDIVPLFCCFRL